MTQGVMEPGQLERMSVGLEWTLRQTISAIDSCERGIALVIDEAGRLLGTITDGDVRRAMLDGLTLQEPVSELLRHRERSDYPGPVTAPSGSDPVVLLAMMRARHVRQIPLLDEGGFVTGLVTLEELLPDEILGVEAVVMAGGFGSRLRPLTDDVPKPMLHLGGKPLMERIVDQLRAVGIRRVNVTTHYRADAIADHFGDGERFGVDINYLNEENPLGTAGALRMVDGWDEPLLVVNGDILTGVDFRAMVEFHQEHDAAMTVAVLLHVESVPYGVVETEGWSITTLVEKPLVRRLITAGIYIVSPEVRGFIPEGERYDMPDLIRRLLAEGCAVAGFPIREYWQDIGRAEDYDRALLAIENGEVG